MRFLSLVWVLVVLACLLAYEVGQIRSGEGVAIRRRGCAWAGAVLAVVAVVGPIGTGAPRSLWMETLQYALVTFGVSPMVMLAAPRLLRRFLARLPAGRHRWLAALIAYIIVMVAWRLPGPVDALAGLPSLVVVEAFTVVAGSAMLWEQLVGSPVGGRRQPPLRMGMAAVGVWSAWVLAFVVGFASHAWYPAYAHPGGSQMGAVASQEVGVLILWVCSGFSFVPVFFATMAGWFAASEQADEAERQAYRRARGLWPSSRHPFWWARNLDGNHGH